MKSSLLLMAGAAVLVLAACDRNGAPAFGPPKMKAVSRLNCPETSGDLRRVSAAADGKSCAYAGDNGDEVVLQLVQVTGDPEAALKPIEASLAALVPSLDAKPVPADAAPAKDASQAAKDAAVATATAASDAAVDAAASVDEGADADADSSHHDDENVEVDFPGIHVTTRGDKKDIKVFGMQIDVDESGDGDSVKVRREPKHGMGRSLSVDANDNGAVVRMANSNKSNIKTTVIYGMESAGPQGHRVVGYVARGPRTGPLVVATVKSKREHDDHVGFDDGVFADATRLARRASRG